MLGCESDGNAGVGSGGGVVAVSEYMGGIRGTERGTLTSASDVLEMSMVRGVGGVYRMCLARGGLGGLEGEWVKGLGLGFTNSRGTW